MWGGWCEFLSVNTPTRHPVSQLDLGLGSVPSLEAAFLFSNRVVLLIARWREGGREGEEVGERKCGRG